MLDYGIIGNCVTSALIKKNASIDWLCFPKVDDPSIFAKILDEKKGGSFEIKVKGRFKKEQQYVPETAILKTTFISESEIFAVYDFFPRYKKLVKGGKYEKLVKENRLIRIIKPIKGKPEIRIAYNPKPGYAAESCEFRKSEKRITCESSGRKTSLVSNVDYNLIEKSEFFRLEHTKYFVIEDGSGSNCEFNVVVCNKLMSDTKRYWQGWVNTLVTPEFNRDMIIRSAITLKLLTYSPTGAILAAPTTSIPEEVGSERTFDYRFCWLRDAAFCVDTLKKLGREYESESLINFTLDIVLRDDHIQPIYGINGETRLTEKVLEHLEGFNGSKPVRIGNAAYDQKQHDIYGVVIDIIYLYYVYYEYGKKLPPKYWKLVRYLVNQIKFNWYRKDSSIWEYRNIDDHYTYSKMMCYVGVDRAIKIAQRFGKSEVINEWLAIRNEIMDDILRKGYNQEVDAFTMSYGSDKLDASMLLMAYHEFLDPDDPRMINTIKAVYENLREDFMVSRYDVDDFGKSESAFLVCSFWLVDALYYIGEKEKAKKIFRKAVKSCNHLGLFSEDIDKKTGKLIGNFPQAYTHIAMINSSILLSEWSAKRKKIDWGVMPRKKGWF